MVAGFVSPHLTSGLAALPARFSDNLAERSSNNRMAYPRRVRYCFSDGTQVTVDFDAGMY